MDPISTSVALGAAGQSSSVPYVGDILIVRTTAPCINAYKWAEGTGFGTKYADPATDINASYRTFVWGADFNPSGTSFVVASLGDTFALQWTTNVGFGTKYTSPATLPGGSQRAVRFSRTGTAVAFGCADSPFIAAYPWSNTTGFGTRFTAPSSLPGNVVTGMNFSPTDNAIVCTSNGANVAAYRWSNSTGFGTRYSNPASVGGLGCDFSPSGNAIVMSQDSVSPDFKNLVAYPWNSTTGFGTRYAYPATLPGTIGQVKFSPSGKEVIAGNSIYSWSDATGFGTRYAFPDSNLLSSGTTSDWSPTGRDVAVAINTSPGVKVYRFTSGVGFGTTYSNPATVLTTDCRHAVFKP